MQFKDLKLNKIYHVLNGNEYSVGILIPLYIEDNKLYTYTIQNVGDSNWLFLNDMWSETADDWDRIEEFKKIRKTESRKKVTQQYIVDRIFTSRIKFD